MLRLNPATLSYALGRQLIQGSGHLKSEFENQLMPLITARLLDRSLQRSNSGSISIGSALSLFLISYLRAPCAIAEVGTYIGNSAAAIGFGACLNNQPFQLFSCDIHPCTHDPLKGLRLPEGSKVQVIESSSTDMFELLKSNHILLDLLHLDGRLQTDDLLLLKSIITKDTLVALDDCEGDEKGHINLDMLRRSGLLSHHVYIEPFERDLFRLWGLETRSTTGFLMPQSLVKFSRQ